MQRLQVNAGEAPPLAYRVISEGFEAVTCLEAQAGFYNYAKRVYPAFVDRMKKPPYLIWRGSVVLLRGL